MSELAERWGTDLQLLRNLDIQKDRDRGRDLATQKQDDTNQVDLKTLHGLDNLKQALLLRFLTPKGELSPLGHPNYGSRLFELIGEPNIETNRNLAKLYTLEALQSEPRVQEIISVDVQPVNKSEVRIHASLKAVESNTVLNLVFPFFLDSQVA